MKKGQIYEGFVEGCDFPCKGKVFTEDGTCIVKDCLPGQKIKFSIKKTHNGKAEGRLLEVIEKSSLETGRTCSHFGLCGGCTYLSLEYETEAKIKEDQVKKLLDSVIPDGTYEWEGIIKSPKIYGYRNKMEFTFGDEYKDGPLSLGLHKKGGFYDIVPVRDCLIVDGDYRTVIDKTIEFFTERQVRFFHRLSHVGYLRHLVMRKSAATGEILIALVTSCQSPWKDRNESDESLVADYKDMLLKLKEEGKIQGEFAGILHVLNDSAADVVASDRTDILFGHDYFYENLLGLKFKVSLFSFFQTNSYSAALLYEKAREYALVGRNGEKNECIFDLYCGTGTITQLMSSSAKKVVGVEIVNDAVEAARTACIDNKIDNCEFISGDVLKVLDDIENKPDMIILDPPRDGIHPKALLKIINYGVDRIVYISCKPTSLVRDLSDFLKSGYKVVKACCADQFPWTANVETVVLLSKGKCSKLMRVHYG